MPQYSNDSILKYLNFIYLRLRDSFDISDEESEDTFKYYREYCRDNGLTPMGYHIFYRELKRIGIETVQYKYPGSEKRARRRIFKLIQLEKLFSPDRPPTKQDTQSVMMSVGGKWFSVLIRVQEVESEDYNQTKPEVDTASNSGATGETSSVKGIN